ncbi:MAG: protein kinase [Myxococcales bacterium]
MAQPGDPAAVVELRTLDVGSTFGGRYVIEKRISEGSFGVVYRAIDREIQNHRVAIKLLFRKASSEAERELALRELRLIASVSHPSVVQFKEYGWLDGRLWFSMPWYQGRPLDSVIGYGDAAVPMSRAEAQPIFTRIAQGLAAMHAVGVQHHDIKPENIFLAEIAGFAGGFPVLLDLGIASRVGENPSGLTISYASPEASAAMLGEDRGPIGSASDVFSLALVLRNALDPSLANQPQGDNPLPALHERAQQAVPLSARADLAFLKPYFARWLSLDPARRPSAEQFADELRVLTRPEEVRAARLKLLKRVGPVVVVAGLVIAVLTLLLRKQTTALNQQTQVLEQERDASEKLRAESAAQLDTIAEQAQDLGDEKASLDRALAVGRKLNDQVKQLQGRVANLNTQKSTLTTQRDGLLQDKQALTTERDGLARDKQGLSVERDGLLRDRQSLTAQRDGLARDKQNLTTERDQLARDRQSLASERDQLLQDRSRLSQQRDQLEQERARAVEQRDQQARDNAKLTEQRDQLAQENARLNAQPRETPAPNAASPSETRDAPVGNELRGTRRRLRGLTGEQAPSPEPAPGP